MDKIPPPLPTSREGEFKTVLNLLVAIPLVLLALWMAVADWRYPGNLLFQDSPSTFVTGLFLVLASLGLVVFAVLPRRLLVTANVLLMMRAGMGWPLSLLVDHSLVCRIISLSLLVLSVFYCVALLIRPGLKLHLRPWVRWGHSFDTVNSLVTLSILTVPVLLLGYFEAGKSVMGSYVRFSWRGVSLVERVFEKEDQRVYLFGMMHIGDGSFYQDLKKRMSAKPVDGHRLVLTEGVGDSQNLLPAEFKSGQLYANLAEALGLEPQHAPVDPEQVKVEEARDFSIPGVVFRNADIDVSELEEEHLAHLVTILKLLATLGTPEFFTAEPKGVSGRDMELLFFDALLGQRNDVLMEHFDESAAAYTEVFIPWGAAHLPDIETRLIEKGYVEQLEVVRPIVEFWD